MEVIKLNNWVIKDNELSISLMKYYVKINIKSEELLVYELTVIRDCKDKLVFYFYNLEEAIIFTQNVIANSRNEEEIVNGYLLFLTEKKRLIKK